MGDSGRAAEVLDDMCSPCDRGWTGRVSPPTMPGTGVTWGTGRTTGNTDGVGGRVIMARQV